MSRRERRPAAPEGNPSARLALFAAMLIALAALGVTAAMPVACGVSALIVAAGYWVSWRGRDRARTAAGQMSLGLMLVVLLVYLITDLFGGAFGGDLPQAHFAVYAAALTSFDVKGRRNCFSHLWHSLIILYIAGLFAWSGLFMLVVIAWGTCVAVFYAVTRDGALASRGPRLRRLGRIAPALAMWLVASIAVFIALPEFPGRPIAVPLLIGIPLSGSGGEALPPTLPLVGSSTAAAGAIDLRNRGRFGDEVAMHVRSASPSYWRAYSLDSYTGNGWERAPDYVRTTAGIGGSDIAAVDEVAVPGEPTLSQSFVVEANLPADIIAAYPIQSVDIQAPAVSIHEDGTVTAPSGLTPGSTYGVVSRVRDLSAARLRRAGKVDPLRTDPAYLVLPDSVTRPTMALAAQLTAGAASEYDAVIAIQGYLATNYPYSLDTPRLPAGADAVNQFLFVDRTGFCEQFSSALAVMLRSQGIPARVAVGYAPGEYDRLTASYTVRNNDAHAWTEVLFHGIGWVPFDASPGFDATPQTPAPGRSFLNLDVLVKVGGVPGGGPAIAAAALLGGTAFGAWALARRLLRRRRLDPLLRRYGAAQHRLRRRHLPTRDPAETVAEHLARLGAVNAPEADRLAPLAQAVSSHLYSS